MKKRLLVSLFVIVVLFVASMPALAGPPEEAGGKWCYLPKTLVVDKVAGGNEFWTTSDEGAWTGTFVGESDDHCSAVLHSTGYLWGHCTVSFESVTVNGQTGGLEMRVLLWQSNPGALWDGNWVITGGTGDLKDLHGQGTMSGPGWLPPDGGTDECEEGFGLVYFSGKTHFKPD